MKTGIFGGAFDPIHKGHIYMAQKAMEEYSLDRILLVPSGHSPNKTENAMTAFSHRYNMCKLASEAVPGIEVSDIEIKDESTSYTYVTLQKLKALYPEDELYFIMGGDSLDYFESWMKPEIIAQTAIILVMVRENFPKQQMEERIAHIKKQFWADIRLLKCDRMDVSSTQVRRLLRAKSQADGDRSPKGAEKKKLKKSLDKQRYQHTLGVMYTAGCLAMANGYSIEKAMLAGLLHDCAKCLSTEKKIGLCVKKNIDITEVEISNPGLLHAKAGMVLAEEEYGIKDAQILHAIRVHTTGEADMGLLDKILFVADYIEPNRCEAPRLEDIRKLAFSDLDRTVAEILYDTINFLNTKSGAIDPTTQITYNYYAKYRDNREE